MQANKPLPEDLNLDNIVTTFATDANARKFLESRLWPTGPVCPRCKTNDQSRIAKDKGKTAREGLYRCNDCHRTFTVTMGTIFEDSHLPVRKWIIALFLICSSKKGFSSLQLQRVLGIGSYKTALFMSHRIRHALKETGFGEILRGTVEADETYIGGKSKGKGARYMGNKTPVVSLVERGGNKRSFAFDNERVTGRNINKVVAEHVHGTATVNTDESKLYSRVRRTHKHRAVNHSKEEYVRYEMGETVTTNTVESSFSLLKRGVVGTFHNISKKHLPLYLAEFDFRWNQRKVTDGERTVAALAKTPGKRLTYKAIKA